MHVEIRSFWLLETLLFPGEILIGSGNCETWKSDNLFLLVRVSATKLSRLDTALLLADKSADN